MMNTQRRRADSLLVQRGLFESRAKAQAAIAAGLVTADDVLVRKPSEAIRHDASIAASPAFPWVSRGGIKLAHALDHTGIQITDRVCLDAGASTGGFTQVLLARGAKCVYAVDVGTAQLHASLRGRPEIVSLENTDIRALDAARLGERPQVITLDVSFISLKLVLTSAVALAARPCHLLALIKPQFEAPRSHIRKGIVRNPAIHAAVCDDIVAFAASLGCTGALVFPSVIDGTDGNREFFLSAMIGATIG